MPQKKVLLLTYGNIDHASSRIRGVNHFNRLKADFKTTWVPRVGVHHKRNLLDRLSFIMLKAYYLVKKYFCIVFCQYDIVFIQILFLPEWMLKMLKGKGTVICYDFDDAVYTYSKTDFDRMIKYADKVVIASPFLGDSFDTKKKDYAVIYSPVDTDLIVPANEEHEVFTIGWIGSPWTAQYLQNLEEVFKQLRQQMNFKLLVVGAQIKVPGIDVACINWSPENELSALKKIDVGIMPLPDTDWAKMKGGYKLFLYLAAGKPVVASPYGINGSIVKKDFNGLKATDDKQWINAFTTLRDDKSFRIQLGHNARKDAEQYYSYTNCSQKLFAFLVS